jgi:hypothetical protein
MLLALQANGRRLSTDEVLAALAMQAMALIGEAGVAELHSVTFPPRLATVETRRPIAVADGAQRAPSRHVGDRGAMLELILGTAPIAPSPHGNREVSLSRTVSTLTPQLGAGHSRPLLRQTHP